MTRLNRSITKRLRRMPDPLGVRESTAAIVHHARMVRLESAGLARGAMLVREKIRRKALLTQSQFGSRVVTSQRVFLQDVVNFCFWAAKGHPRWEVEYPTGTKHNGWYALTACFERAIAEGIPILDAAFLSRLTMNDARHIFRGSTGIPIPLLRERRRFLQDAGATLAKKYEGKVTMFLSTVGKDAGQLAREIIRMFPSFEDAPFYKRAQICAYDLSLLPKVTVHNLEVLTAFADYKLPQLLRHMGVIRYTESLAQRVDRMEPVPRTSREEVEIRAATIWACELIAQELGVPAATVDNALWLETATTKFPMRPYHRTLTTCY